MGRITGVLIALALATALVLPAAAQATFPGENGKIAFLRQVTSTDFEIYVMNPDGSGETPLTSGPANDGEHDWSPDGSKIAFTSNRDGNVEIYVMNADGTTQTRVTNTPADEHSPTWSPDGTKLAFSRGVGSVRSIFSINIDGSGETPIIDDGNRNSEPAWSPDGGKIAYVVAEPPPGDNTDRIATANLDGTGVSVLCCFEQGTANYATSPDWSPDGQQIAFTFGGFVIRKINRDGTGLQGLFGGGGFNNSPSWSPDGTRIAFRQNSVPPPPFPTIYVMQADGSGATPLTPGSFTSIGPDWQPILKGYPRPKGAGTTYFPLVPAYDACTTPNRVHAPPLAYQSCNPPAKTSPRLTLGTPDANSRSAASTAYLKLGVNGVYTTPADDAEIGLQAQITDVRNHSDLSDYTGALELRFTTRITDKSNTPYPGGPGPGTLQDISYSFTVPCTATADPAGSTCAIATTADALAPGTAIENRRAIWQLGTVEARDGGPDGDASTPAGNTTFLRQGIFVP